MWFQVHYPPLVGVLPTDSIGNQNVCSFTFLNLSANSFAIFNPEPTIFTFPFPNNDTIGAWLFNIWNSPFTPGTATEVTSPLNNVASGDTISKIMFLSYEL
jgi:hypothetical protein